MGRERETVLSWEDDAGAAVTAIFDCVMSETHDRSNTITKHPIEESADASDHVQVNLPTFNIEGYVSNSPLPSNPGVIDVALFKEIELQIPSKPVKIGISALIGAGVDAIGDALSPGAPKALMMTFANFKDRVVAAEKIIEEARTSVRAIRVITRVCTYENMFISSLVITRTPDDGTGATFALTVEKIATVSPEIVDAPEPAELSGQPTVNAGNQHAKEDDEKVQEKKVSLLKKIKEQGLGAFGL